VRKPLGEKASSWTYGVRKPLVRKPLGEEGSRRGIPLERKPLGEEASRRDQQNVL
jgi:hypothetical protein